jgi:UDP-N-acetylglucosamine 1-carboxyvinyltransferase
LELNKLNAEVDILDPHRVYISGPTKWKPADVIAPPALRPTVVVLLAMLAAPGVSTLRNVYQMDRGYEQLAQRLNSIGADIQPLLEF